MSGFVAVVTRGAPATRAQIERLLAPEVAAGVDDTGIWVDGGVGMGHALVVTRQGATVGPHRSPRGAVIAGDIRLDDRDALVAALRGAGATLIPHATDDDALVLAAYDAWGERALERLHGDFAFALWDPAARRLLVARDPLGVRPLFFAETRDGFVCASCMEVVRAHPAVGSALHAPAILSFLQWGFNVDPATTSFADVARLPAASTFTVDGAGRRSPARRYWEFPVPAPRSDRDVEALLEEYRAVLGAAVADRMRSPSVGLLLSGGIDSTSIAVAMRDQAQGARIETQTWDGSHLAPDDEGRLGALVAAHLGLPHERRNHASRYLGFLDDLTRRMPEPWDNPEQDLIRAAAQSMAQRTRVQIVGEDGDALFEPPGLLTMWRTLPRAATLAAIVRYTAQHGRRPHMGFWLRRRWRDLWTSPVPTIPGFVRDELRATIGSQTLPTPPRHPTRPESHESLAATTWQVVHETATPAHLGARLEQRWPLLDERVLRFVWSVPPVPWCQRKELVRRAFAAVLPPEITDRPKVPYRYVPPWSPTAFATRTFSPRLEAFIAIGALRRSLDAGDGSPAVSRALALDHWLSMQDMSDDPI